jgi:hypothetical protein
VTDVRTLFHNASRPVRFEVSIAVDFWDVMVYSLVCPENGGSKFPRKALTIYESASHPILKIVIPDVYPLFVFARNPPPPQP